MGYKFNNETPIYLQIIEEIKKQIINKVYMPNEKLPSVRELSLMFEVNPNTIQKALNELEEIGLIYTERTNGKFVSQNEEVINLIRNKTIETEIKDFCCSMKNLGVSKSELIEIIKGEDWLWVF